MKGRTYRYFRGEPLFPFGYGLSYTTFAYGIPTFKDNKIKVSVTNTGKVEGTEIIQVYLRRQTDTEGPSKTLRGYARVNLKAGEQSTVEIDFPHERFETWDSETHTMRVLPGKYELMVGPNSADDQLQRIVVII